MALEYNPSDRSVLDPVRKLRVSMDRRASDTYSPDMNQAAYRIIDESGGKISAFRACFITTPGLNGAHCITAIILKDTIAPHQNVSVEFVAESLLILTSKGQASKEEFITMELAETMFAAQEKYPGRFPNFEWWAKASNYPISDGSRPPNPDSVKVLHKPAKRCQVG